MRELAWTLLHALMFLATLAFMVGCATTRNNAPVVERPVPAAPDERPIDPKGAASPTTAAAEPPRPMPGAENAGKPGYYMVRPGDTLIRVGLESGQNWRDIARWNGIDNPNLIEVGQVLRVVPPGIDAAVAVTRPIVAARPDARPVDVRPTPAVPQPNAATVPVPIPAPVASAGQAAQVTQAPVAATAPREGDDDVNWMWPASGTLGAGFEEGRSKGLAILGKAGDAVYAAAEGRVMYAGSGLRGYGNMIIIKHNALYLTAYAHNQTLLVKEDQTVRRGQKIAEMGASDAERVQLHFEIRRQGKPIDPLKLLPTR